MKETTPHDATTATATRAAGKPRLVVGLDVDLNFCVTAIQAGHGPVRPAQKWTRAQLVKWVREQVAAGLAVHTVYEACGFGYTLHGELTAAGAHSVVTTPTRLSPERRRMNHGRALRLEHGHATLPGGWAGPRKWRRIAAGCSPFVRELLEPVAAQLRQVVGPQTDAARNDRARGGPTGAEGSTAPDLRTLLLSDAAPRGPFAPP